MLSRSHRMARWPPILPDESKLDGQHTQFKLIYIFNCDVDLGVLAS